VHPTSDHTRSTLRPWLGVGAITASLFVFLTTELMPVGLLTPLGHSLKVEVGVAALMVTLYGVAAGLGVPFIVAWTRRVDRHVLLCALLAVLVAGNLLTSVAPTFALVLITRLVMGFANGVFWAIGVSMAMRLVPEHQANRAAAIVMSGISLATVVGLPLGVFVANLTGWRTTFLIWAGLGALVFLGVALLVPSLPSKNTVSVREVFVLPLRNPALRLVLVAVVLFVLGHFGAYTFVRPVLEDHASASTIFVTVVLMVFGAGGAVGTFVGGRMVARSARVAFVLGSAATSVSLVLLLAIGNRPVGAVVSLSMWGVSFGVVQLAEINLTLAAAPETFEAAMSLNTMAYNTSIALGALIGGGLVDATGVTQVVWLGAGLTAAAAGLALVTGSRRSTAPIDERLTVAA
jgi:predicted MFS family arabinose efflux permease